MRERKSAKALEEAAEAAGEGPGEQQGAHKTFGGDDGQRSEEGGGQPGEGAEKAQKKKEAKREEIGRAHV